MILNKKRLLGIVFAFFMMMLLYIGSLVNYLLFHSIAEIFSICIAFTIFLITWNSKKFLNNNFLVVIGVAYLFIGFLDLFHTLSYKGMNIFTDYDYYANQLWIATRFLESITILVSFILLNRKKSLDSYFVFAFYFIITSIITLMVFCWKIFPICFVDGTGLTKFKIISEYIISFILIVALFISYYYRNFFDKLTYKYISFSILFTILSELSFTFYISNYGFSNMIGHYFKIFSFYLIYKAVIEKGLKEPQNLIFMELQSEVKRDGLTGLINHRYLYEKLEEEISRTWRTSIPFSIIIFDVDFFKKVNDRFGHVKGDEVLVGIGKSLKMLTRSTDIVGRYGGEEFMVILPDTDIENCYIVAEKIRNEIKRMDYLENGTKITVSAGIAQFNMNYEKSEEQSISIIANNFVNIADTNLYKAKAEGRDKTVGINLI